MKICFILIIIFAIYIKFKIKLYLLYTTYFTGLALMVSCTAYEH